MKTLYFIQARDLVKIGVTDDVPGRVAQLQTGNPAKLVVAATLADATFSIEKIYHHALKRWRVRGEWFSQKPLRHLIQNIHDGARPLDEASIVHYLGLAYRGPKRERTPPPEGFGNVMGEVRAAFKSGPEEWPRTRVILMARGGLYPQAVAALDKRRDNK